jgi:hypothetical protein
MAEMTGYVVYQADPERSGCNDSTGIYVRAMREGQWTTVDIAELDRESLLAWIDRGGEGFARRVVLAILGHLQED